MGENDIVYQLCPGMEGTEAPVAVFSDKDTIDALIDRLRTFIEGGVSLKQVRAEENLLPVDKYAFLVEIGLVPYDISLHRDGHLFDPADLLGNNLDELTIEEHYEHVVAMRAAELADPDKMWGIGGVFWAPSLGLAIKKAKLMRKILFTVLDIPFKSEKAKSRKKYTLQEVIDLSTWFEYKLSTPKSAQFIDEIDLSEEEIKEGLSAILTSAREEGGASSAHRHIYKSLKKIWVDSRADQL
ncbi:hypothetical protein [Dyadobacter fanqingshengii]|uniref:Uncharacterized protein n=1 Tax=Dyadobacter fanqingshengii TaxID=2906443 RepID=A0A9X1TC82_9BACT|nr:hypothetical protein [Dyadobacter fanqingshengii]MCF0043656.1 hypothetical protein [Dyadobacter fanqingshengii]USJ34728.1 hypothetical protein NFI81_18695 [Dyadobacter fanqingshengii]